MRPSNVARVVEAMAAEIGSGHLPPGRLLPTHRRLAAQYGIAVASASKVYAQLKAQGLVVGEAGRGTFVRDRPPQRAWDSADEARLSAQAIDLSFNHPTWAGQGAMLRAMLRDLAASGDLAALLHQQPPGGRMHERRIVARFLQQQRGIEAAPERIFLVGGAQHGLDIATRALLRPHDAVAVDALTYPGFRMLATGMGLALRPVPAAAGGPDLDALDAACSAGDVRAIYSMPTLHNPLGWVMGAAQRRRMVAIARQRGCLLIEDAAYAFLGGRSPTALAALAPDCTVYVSSLSKSLASGLRFGFIVVPPGSETRIKATIRASYWSLSSVVTAMATRWIADGTVARQETALRRDASRRQAVAAKVFAGMPLVAHPASLFLWLPLPEDVRMDRIATRLAAAGIAVSKGEAYATTVHAPHALRLGLGSMPFDQLEPALRQVREAIERFPI